MLAAYATRFDPDQPLRALAVGDIECPEVPDGWASVRVRAASLNHHDLWSLRGVGLRRDQLPMVLGCDAAGVDDGGSEVIVHGLIGDPDWRGDETLDPQRSLLSERHPGTFAERVAVPRRNLLPKPAALSFAEAACLPTAWLTAYRMLFTAGRIRPGQTVLVQGVTGGVASAAIRLASAAGARVWATSRDEANFAFATAAGAEQVFASGGRLPERVDLVVETVGEPTWAHSLRSVRAGGAVVVAGATAGGTPRTELAHIFFRQVRVLGVTMGTREELADLTAFCARSGIRPVVDRTFPLAEAAEALSLLEHGRLRGKIVLEHR